MAMGRFSHVVWYDLSLIFTRVGEIPLRRQVLIRMAPGVGTLIATDARLNPSSPTLEMRPPVEIYRKAVYTFYETGYPSRIRARYKPSFLQDCGLRRRKYVRM